jgi:hypothetical protein
MNMSGRRRLVAICPAVRKIPEPITPPTSSITASSSERPLTNVGSLAGTTFVADIGQPIANSSEDSSGVPHTRQITDPQSPHVSGSFTGFAHCGQ